MANLNVKALVNHFGGRVMLCDKLKASRFSNMTIKGIDKWHERQQIPTPRLIELMLLAKNMKRPIDLYKFILTKKGGRT